MAGYGTFQEYLNQPQQNTLPAKPTTYTASPISNIPRTPMSQYYQVKPEDTDLSSVSNNLGVPLNQLVDANDGAKTLPPIGSYIQTQPQGANSFYSPTAGANVAQAGGFQQGMNTILNRTGNPETVNRITGSFMSTSGVNTAELQYSINAQIQAGNMPPVVPFGINITDPSTGKPATTADMIANGYSYNNVTKQWELKAAVGGATTPGAPGGPQTGNNWMTNPALQMTTWGRGKNKFKTTMKWAQNAARRKRRGSTAQPVVAQADNAGGTASTVLELRLGSG